MIKACRYCQHSYASARNTGLMCETTFKDPSAKLEQDEYGQWIIPKDQSAEGFRCFEREPGSDDE